MSKHKKLVSVCLLSLSPLFLSLLQEQGKVHEPKDFCCVCVWVENSQKVCETGQPRPPDFLSRTGAEDDSFAAEEKRRGLEDATEAEAETETQRDGGCGGDCGGGEAGAGTT